MRTRSVALLLFAAPVLGACSLTGGAVAPGDMPEGASSAIYTASPPQAVADCIAAAVGGTVAPSGNVLVVEDQSEPRVRYSVTPMADAGVYATQVAVSGVETDQQQAARVSACANPGPRA